MDVGLSDSLQEKNEGSIKKAAEQVKLGTGVGDSWKQHPEFVGDVLEVNRADAKSKENVLQGVAPANKYTPGEVNMEASITPDDVMRAGGFGARDDINSFLPVASDSTDFEASLRDAREYEDQQEEIQRPGLGWQKQ